MEPTVREPRPETGMAAEERTAKLSGWIVGILVFIVAYALFIHAANAWGIALGWAPSAAIGTAIGWIVYCFPWLLDVLWLLMEFLAAIAP